MIFIESIVNLGGIVVDLVGIFFVVKVVGVLLIVDNMLVIFVFCWLFEYGVDIIVYLVMKFLGGYGNFIGGLIVDGGSFDWFVGGKYLIFFEFCVFYYGVKLYEMFGLIVFVIVCRMFGFWDLGFVLLLFNVYLIVMGMEIFLLCMFWYCENV